MYKQFVLVGASILVLVGNSYGEWIGGTRGWNFGNADTNFYPWSTACRVGIGTTSPGYPLDVEGNVRVNGVLYIPSTSGYEIYSENTAGFNVYSAGPQYLYGDSTLTMTITNSNVGIGTMTPGSYKLYVNGSANATALYENGTALSSKYDAKDVTHFSFQPSYVAVRTPGRTVDQYYEFWDGGVGWANIYCGTVTQNSKKSDKHNFKTIDSEVLLEKLKNISFQEWSYKPGIGSQHTHFGPFAEEFYEAYNLGTKSGLVANDLAGLALAMIKEQQRQIEDLKTEIETLKSQLNNRQ